MDQFLYPKKRKESARLLPASWTWRKRRRLETENVGDDGVEAEELMVITVEGARYVSPTQISFFSPPVFFFFFPNGSGSTNFYTVVPAVGGLAKSQLVHQVDALGGEIGKMADSQLLSVSYF
ncbi:hypothetical protein MRB53_006118 [Persea americana]|uniref:Uncharacterized protein n=1 Tax=Persea americana TaxID=3435 RepID=A0ACC2MFD3_PERAE|nr:hypothetical protein MRB53_006118 [Persea americana]